MLYIKVKEVFFNIDDDRPIARSDYYQHLIKPHAKNEALVLWLCGQRLHPFDVGACAYSPCGVPGGKGSMSRCDMLLEIFGERNVLRKPITSLREE